MKLTVTITTLISAAQAFSPLSSSKPAFFNSHIQDKSSTQLHVFDFFKQRATEGVDQLKNLSEKTAKGKLIEGLTDAASYTSTTNAAFADGLAKSRNQLLYNLDDLFNGGGDIIEELEDILLRADLGTKTSMDVMEEVRSLRQDSTDIFSRDDLRSVLRGKLIEALIIVKKPDSQSKHTDGDLDLDVDVEEATEEEYNPQAIMFSKDDKLPTVLFIMGANGMGKTTTIGKLASRLKNEGNQTVLLAACDTFRAGAVEQLEMWGERAEVDCYCPNEQQKTPSAVLYGALDLTIKDNYDVLIVDTSGRLSNNDALTEELAKMKRVIQKKLSVEEVDGKAVPNLEVPHETLLVIDAAQGRMALDSAKVWDQEIGLTGLVLTKLDGSARGGSVVAVSRELGLPVKLIGVGEKIEDLRDFDPESFVDGLLGIGAAGGSANKDEGKVLAGRLDQMRKARDERAQVKKTETKEVPVGSGPGMPDMQTEMDSDPQASTGPKNPANKMKNKNKKKKKRKGKR